MTTPVTGPQGKASLIRPEAVDVVLPAGGRITGAFAQMAGVDIKALINLDGETILRRTIHTLRATMRVRRIVVVGPEPALTEAWKAGADGAIAEGSNGPENLFRGMVWLRSHTGTLSTRTLIVATDLPFLTTAALNGFLDQSQNDADITIPLITQQAFETHFPGSINEFTHLRDGVYTLGCAFLVNATSLLRNRPHIEQIYEARKSNLQMARLLGPTFVARYLAKQLTIAHVQERCQKILGCSGVAIPDAPPELAYDIDLPEEFRYALETLSRKKESAR